MSDPYNLSRFIDAQEPLYERVVQELASGRKRTHWMWFIFPQIAGLGHSWTAQKYAIGSLEEARAYGAHPILGARLGECTRQVLTIEGRSVSEIFGYPDDLKFRSSMTLFKLAAEEPALFAEALDKYFDGAPDARTIELLNRA